MGEKENKLSLLLVDDEEEFIDATVGPLTRRGFEMTTASNGADALRLIEIRSFDAVVLDVKMPGIDGIEVFTRINELRPDLPVILLTGHGTIQQAFETSKDGVFEYLTKPCDIEVLADTARRATHQKGAHEVELALTEETIRLLLVDDDEDFLDALTPALERRGIQVTAVNNAEEAIDRINSQAFDVGLLDLRLPDINGLDLFDLIAWKQPAMKIIILTGYPSSDSVLEAFKKRAFDFLIKPQEVVVLHKKICQAFEHGRVRAERK